MGVVALLASTQFGGIGILFIGIVAFLVACGIAGGARMPFSIPAKDMLLYIGISIALVIGIVLYAFHAAHAKTQLFDLNNRWVLILFTAAFVFGSSIKNFRQHWHRPAFWVIFAGLLAAHFEILLHVFPGSTQQVPFLLSVPVSLGEMFVVYTLFGISGFPLKPPQSDGLIQ